MFIFCVPNERLKQHLNVKLGRTVFLFFTNTRKLQKSWWEMSVSCTVLSTGFRQRSSSLWIQSPVKKEHSRGNEFLPVWKMQTFFLIYILLQSWQRRSKPRGQFRSISQVHIKTPSYQLSDDTLLSSSLYACQLLCLVRVSSQRHCRSERVSRQSRLREARRLRPVEVHRGWRILQR